MAALQLRRVILACGDVIFTVSRQCRSSGRLAQLGEHHVRIVGVVGSNPIPSTKLFPSDSTVTATFFESDQIPSAHTSCVRREIRSWTLNYTLSPVFPDGLWSTVEDVRNVLRRPAPFQ
jgi:hypothetical protein